MKKNLTKNIPLKIMSVIVGILVWLIVVNVDDPIVTKGFVISDVQIINEAYVDQLGEMVMQDDSENTVRVYITGSRNIYTYGIFAVILHNHFTKLIYISLIDNLYVGNHKTFCNNRIINIYHDQPYKNAHNDGHNFQRDVFSQIFLHVSLSLSADFAVCCCQPLSYSELQPELHEAVCC